MAGCFLRLLRSPAALAALALSAVPAVLASYVALPMVQGAGPAAPEGPWAAWTALGAAAFLAALVLLVRSARRAALAPGHAARLAGGGLPGTAASLLVLCLLLALPAALLCLACGGAAVLIARHGAPVLGMEEVKGLVGVAAQGAGVLALPFLALPLASLAFFGGGPAGALASSLGRFRRAWPALLLGAVAALAAGSLLWAAGPALPPAASQAASAALGALAVLGALAACASVLPAQGGRVSGEEPDPALPMLSRRASRALHACVSAALALVLAFSLFGTAPLAWADGASATYQTGPKSFTTVVGGVAAAYTDEQGGLQEIDNTLLARAPEGPGGQPFFENAANSFSVRLPAGAGGAQGIRVGKDGREVGLIPLGADLSRASAQGNAVRYTEAFPNVDYQYTLIGTVVKEDIVLNCAGTQHSFSTEVAVGEGLELVGLDGAACVFEAGADPACDEPFLAITAPVMVDAAGAVSDSVGLSFEHTGEGRGLVTVAAYEGWLADGRRHGQGSYRDASGWSYTGSWQADARQGHGTLSHADGSVYEGSFVQDREGGQGRLRSAAGWSYEGSFKGGLRHGQGSVAYGDGSTYEGSFKNGAEDGQGAYTSSEGWSYAGAFKAGLRHGYGRLAYADGSAYEGSWAYDARHGQGTQTYVDGRGSLAATYTGQWADNRRHGRGTLAYPSGHTQQGLWQDDEFLP